ncbi:hypothetical protein MNBD_DELTA02-493 [hydrothermal vent metagenome]|uniref:Phage holin family protein n=1 Tax=hydrothermal vent metagenome TaxID=652676 RepID=A0A3B0VJI4_9ZZZZ
MIKAIIIRFLAVTVTILILPYIVPGISVELATDGVVVALVLGFLNIFLKPVMRLASLPLRLLTLGLFSLVINGALLWIAAKLVDGFTIAGFPEAVFGAIIISTVSLFARLFLGGKR